MTTGTGCYTSQLLPTPHLFIYCNHQGDLWFVKHNFIPATIFTNQASSNSFSTSAPYRHLLPIYCVPDESTQTKFLTGAKSHVSHKFSCFSGVCSSDCSVLQVKHVFIHFVFRRKFSVLFTSLITVYILHRYIISHLSVLTSQITFAMVLFHTFYEI